MKILLKIALMITLSALTSCLGQNKEKHIYLAGWELDINGDEQCQKFLKTQVINKNSANKIWSAIDLVFVKDKLVKAYNIEEGFKTVRELKSHEIGFKYEDLKPNQIFSISESSEKSKTYFGGEVPNGFEIPKFNFNAPFQYLGMISKSNEAFNWLPFDLHLTAPIYHGFNKLFIDYSNPLKPKVININELKENRSSFDFIDNDFEITFNKTYIKTKKQNTFLKSIGHTGVPNWIQYPAIPTCPNSKKTMKFLCQLNYDGMNIKTKRTNIKTDENWQNKYFQNLNFWGDGDLYIFFEPTSKIACYIIQHT